MSLILGEVAIEKMSNSGSLASSTCDLAHEKKTRCKQSFIRVKCSHWGHLSSLRADVRAPLRCTKHKTWPSSLVMKQEHGGTHHLNCLSAIFFFFKYIKYTIYAKYTFANTIITLHMRETWHPEDTETMDPLWILWCRCPFMVFPTHAARSLGSATAINIGMLAQVPSDTSYTEAFT